MKKDILKIINIFSDELEMLSLLEKITSKKTNYLTSNNIVELDNIISKEQVILMKFAFFQAKKRDAIHTIKLGGDIVENVTLKSLKEYCDLDNKKKIDDILRKQDVVLGNITKYNTANRKIVNYKIENINSIIQNMNSKKDYYEKGNEIKIKPISVIDKKI